MEFNDIMENLDGEDEDVIRNVLIVNGLEDRVASLIQVKRIKRHDEVTTVETYYGPDAVKTAKRNGGTAFHFNPKVIKVMVIDYAGKVRLELEKNPVTLKCFNHMSA